VAEWRAVSLRELGQLFDGPHATPSRVAEGPYFMNIASLENGRLDLSKSDHVSEEDFARWTRRVTPTEGDLLFSYETRLGDAALMPPSVRACLGRRMALLRPNRERFDPRFVLYYWLSPDFQAVIERNTIHGATVNRIPLSAMANWTVTLPPLGEQREIADVLGALDDRIAANARLSEGAERLALALVESSGSLVPLGDVVTHRKLVVDPSALTSERVAHFSLPAFDSGRTPEMVEPRTIKSSKFLVTSPSVLVSKLNPRFLRTWDVATVPDRPALASTEFLVLEPRFSTSTVMWALLSQSTFGAVLESKVAGTSGSHQRVRPEDLLGTPVPDPRAMSDKLKDQVTSLGLRAIQARVESDHLAATRGALLPALMSGRLRVRDAQRDSAGRSQVG